MAERLGRAVLELATEYANFPTGLKRAKTGGDGPATEHTHAALAATDEDRGCKEAGKGEVILFNRSGHGNFAMQAYTDYLGGALEDYEYSEQEVALALAGLPSVG